MTDFSKIIRDRRAELGLTLEELGNEVGVGKSTIRKWEQGTIKQAKRDKIAKLAKALRIDVALLVADEDNSDIVYARNIFKPNFQTVPIIGTIACGEPILAQENVEGLATKSDHIEADFALWCKGDSMTPRFNDGDLVFIRQQSDVDNGQIAAVLIENEATLKHVYKQSDRLTLIAENPSFPPLIYTDPVELQQIRILGLVTGYQRAVNQ